VDDYDDPNCIVVDRQWCGRDFLASDFFNASEPTSRVSHVTSCTSGTKMGTTPEQWTTDPALHESYQGQTECFYRPSGPVAHLAFRCCRFCRACYQSVCAYVYRAFFGYFLSRSEFIVLVVFSVFLDNFYISLYVPTMLESKFFKLIINHYQKVSFVRVFLIVSHGIPIPGPQTHADFVFVTLIWYVFFIPAHCISCQYFLRVV
jgi:hypothetical protein